MAAACSLTNPILDRGVMSHREASCFRVRWASQQDWKWALQEEDGAPDEAELPRKFETVTWMVELPFAFPIKPDTSIVKNLDHENPVLQCTRKTDLAVSSCQNAEKR